VNKRTREIAIAILAVIAVGVSLYFTFAGRAPKIDAGPYEALGIVTAEETAKLLGNKGLVLVMVADTGAFKNPSVEAELSAFQQTLKRQKEMNVITVKIPATPMQMMATGGGVTAGQLLKAVESHSNLTGLVLFLAFPQLSDSELAQIKKSGAKTVVVSSLRPGYERLMEEGALQVIIVPRPEPPTSNTPLPRTVRERFDQDFAIITAPDAARLR
jgi:hypothetical protein